MNKMMKKTIAMTLALASCVSMLTGCNPPVPDDENTLQIYIGNFGYGTEWLDQVVEGFKAKDWVKAKYPELNIPKIESNSEKTYPIEQINSGSTTVDLWFSTAGASADLVKKNASGVSNYENMNDLFEKEIPGETVTVAGKMQENFLQGSDYGNKEESVGEITTEYMQFPWVAGYIGLIYNETLVNEWLGSSFEMPLTTDALIDMAKTLKGTQKDGKNAPKTFALSYTTDYWTCFFNTWWAQYSGLETVQNFNSGKVKSGLGWQLSHDIFKDEGRLETLKVMQECLWYENEYIHGQTNSLSFDKIQARFRNGEAFFMMNGDWLEMELGGSTGSNVFKFLKSPIISSIVETMDLYTDDGVKYTDLDSTKRQAYDEQLKAIVRAVDAGETSLAGVSANDFKKVQEARNYVSTVGGHYAYIPSYAKAKGLAKDFLLYMASDEAIKIFMNAEKGASTAFNYEVPQTMADNFSAFQKSRIEIIKSGKYVNVGTPSRLTYYGGLAVITRNNPLESRFVSQLETDRKTAQTIFDADIIHFTGVDSKGVGTPNTTNWDLMLQNAGLN